LNFYYKLVNAADPTHSQDAATKNYVDNIFLGTSVGVVDKGNIST